MYFFVCFLFSLSIIILRLIYVLFANNLFYCWVVFCCIDISRCVYPLTCWGTFVLFPVFGFSNKAVTIVYRCVLSFVLKWGWQFFSSETQTVSVLGFMDTVIWKLQVVSWGSGRTHLLVSFLWVPLTCATFWPISENHCMTLCF